MVILVGENNLTKDDNVVFDTRDFHKDHLSVKALRDELYYIFETITDKPENIAFILLEKLETISYVEIFMEIAKMSQLNKYQSAKIIVESDEIKEFFETKTPSQDKLHQEYKIGNCKILLCTGDITSYSCDAIVNASNTMLKLGAGVSGAIKENAGPGLQTEMTRKGPIKVGAAVATSSLGMSNCSTIIHTATASGSATVVYDAVVNSLKICLSKNLSSVTFPALGTGTGGLRKKTCAETMFSAIQTFIKQYPESLILETISIVLWTNSDFETFRDVFENYSFFNNA